MDPWSAYRQNDDEEKVYVGDVVELKPKILWDETQCSVFRRPNLVLYELLPVMTVFCLHFLRQRHVDEYSPRTHLHVLITDFLSHRTVVCHYLVSICVGLLLLERGEAGSGVSIEDRESLLDATLARKPLGRPSHALDRLGDIAIAAELDLRHVPELSTSDPCPPSAAPFVQLDGATDRARRESDSACTDSGPSEGCGFLSSDTQRFGRRGRYAVADV